MMDIISSSSPECKFTRFLPVIPLWKIRSWVTVQGWLGAFEWEFITRNVGHVCHSKCCSKVLKQNLFQLFWTEVRHTNTTLMLTCCVATERMLSHISTFLWVLYAMEACFSSTSYTEMSADHLTLVTVGRIFLMKCNWVSKPMWNFNVKGNFSNSQKWSLHSKGHE